MNTKDKNEEKGNVLFISLGCPKNQVDSEIMIAHLIMNGYGISNDPEDADFAIVNTCGFIQEAIDESLAEMKNLVEFRENFPESGLKKIIMVGCLVERLGIKNLDKILPGIDCFVDVNSPEKIVQALESGKREFHSKDLYLMTAETPRIIMNYPHIAYLKISEGCSNQCTFCTIPAIRGKYRSRTSESILKEFGNLQKLGVSEVILISQDSSYYGKDLTSGIDLSSLLKKIDRENKTGIWVRVMYLHPDRIDNELIDTVLKADTILPYFDLPLQHTSDKILRLMGRKRKMDELQKFMEKISTSNKKTVIRNTFIVGFPGETEKEFNELLEFVTASNAGRIGLFRYSDELGTPAYMLEGKNSTEEIDDRFNQLAESAEKKMLRFNSSLINKTLPVIIDGIEKDEYFCRTQFDAPEIDIPGYLETKKKLEEGNIINAKLTSADSMQFNFRF